MDEHAHPNCVAILTRRLASALCDLGLTAEPFGANMVWSVNRAADPASSDAGAIRMNPGMRQTVVCRADEENRLAWWWVCTAAMPDATPEYELLGPAVDIETAAAKIARVLALRPEAVS